MKLSARECRICGTSCYYQSRVESRICGLIRCSLRHFFFSCCLHNLRIARNMLHNRQIQSFSRLVWLAVFASCLHMKRTAVSKKNSNIKFLRCCFRPFDSLSFSVSPPLFVTFPLVTPFRLISMIQEMCQPAPVSYSIFCFSSTLPFFFLPCCAAWLGCATVPCTCCHVRVFVSVSVVAAKFGVARWLILFVALTW